LKPPTHIAIAFLVAKGLRAAGIPVNQRGVLLGSVLPDVDYLLVPFAPRFAVHRTVTHTLLWTALAAGLVGRLWNCGAWSTWLGGLTHLAADELNSCDTRHGRWPRIAWLFPFDLWRRPWKRCLVDMGAIPGPEWVGQLLVEVPIILLGLWGVWQKRKR